MGRAGRGRDEQARAVGRRPRAACSPGGGSGVVVQRARARRRLADRRRRPRRGLPVGAGARRPGSRVGRGVAETGTPHADAPHRACPRRLPRGERRRVLAGRHPARLVRDLGRPDRELARGRPRPARRRAATPVGPPGRHVQHGCGRSRRPCGSSTPSVGPSGRCGRRTAAAPRSRRWRTRSTPSRRPTASSTPCGSSPPRTRPRRAPELELAEPDPLHGVVAPLVSTRVARLRVGRMFCTRLGSLMESQIPGELDGLEVDSAA